MEFLKPKTSCKTSCFFLNDAMFWRCFWKSIDVDVFDDVLQNAKHRAYDASNDVNRPPLMRGGIVSGLFWQGEEKCVSLWMWIEGVFVLLYVWMIYNGRNAYVAHQRNNWFLYHNIALAAKMSWHSPWKKIFLTVGKKGYKFQISCYLASVSGTLPQLFRHFGILIAWPVSP